MSTLSDDERFAAMIAAEFPDAVFHGQPPHSQASPSTQPSAQPTAPPATPMIAEPPPAPADTAPVIEPISAAPPPSVDPGLFRVWTPPEEPEEEFVPPPTPVATPWSTEGKVGVGLIGFAVAMVLLAAFGATMPLWVAIVSGAALFGGTALLLRRLAKSPPPDDDGAVL
ncbi:MAG: hypothetical protein WAS07_01085 [Micropruina sp.]